MTILMALDRMHSDVAMLEESLESLRTAKALLVMSEPEKAVNIYASVRRDLEKRFCRQRRGAR